MLLAVVIFTLIGTCMGVVTGLVPGIHINNVAYLIMGAQAILTSFTLLLFSWSNPTNNELTLLIASLIIGCLITHAFLDFIPSIYLGAPQGETALSVLPGHRMLLEGCGYEGIKCTAFGSLLAVFLSLLLIIPVRLFMGSPVNGYAKLLPLIPYILILIVTLMIITEGRQEPTKEFFKKKGWALAIFLLSGIFGFIVLETPGLLTRNRPLISQALVSNDTILMFPLFTGLFGLSTLSLSMIDTPKIPEQKTENVKIRLSKLRKARGVISGTIAGLLVGWFPGVTSAEGTVVAKMLSGSDEKTKTGTQMKDQKEFLIAVSGVNTANAIFNIVALFVILKARCGALIAVQQIAEGVIKPWEPLIEPPNALMFMLVSVLVSAVLAYFLTLYFGKVFAKACSHIPYRKIGVAVIIFLLIILFIFSGILGLAIAGIGVCIGLLPPLVGVRRVHLMGCLLLPIILVLLGYESIILKFLGMS